VIRAIDLFFSILLFCVLAQGEIHSPRPEISVVAQAEVAADQPIKLIDIASVSFVSSEHATMAFNIPVLPAQADGETKKIHNADLIKILRAKIGGISEIAEEKWAYFIPEEVEIRAKKILISAQSVQNQLTIAIRSRCGDCKVNLHDVKIPQIREKISFESCELQVDSVKAGGSFLVPVQCRFGNESKTYWISGSSKISKLAPVTTRQLNPGEKITAHDFQMQEVDVTYAKDGVPGPEDVEGQLASRMLMVNQPIFKSDYKRELAINRGQIIKVISGNESFEIVSQAIAEEQGYVGDLIRIKNSESQKVLSGQIVDKGVVKVQ
jgi:flagella basal body P-ring formation protein FlgA